MDFDFNRAIDNFKQAFPLDDLLGTTSKWGLLMLAGLQAVFALLALKQIRLLDQFIPTFGGKIIETCAAVYTVASIVFFIGCIIYL